MKPTKYGYHWFQTSDARTGKPRYYFYKLIRCGKSWCRSCPHGPYLYERRCSRLTGQLKRRDLYIGKVGSEKEQKILSTQLALDAHLERTLRPEEETTP